jgi:hypothetical protein
MIDVAAQCAALRCRHGDSGPFEGSRCPTIRTVSANTEAPRPKARITANIAGDVEDCRLTFAERAYHLEACDRRIGRLLPTSLRSSTTSPPIRRGTRAGVQARIQAIIDLLLQHPHIGTRTNDLTIRRMTAVPYPYLIFYEATESEIIIHAVRHAARDPSGMPGSA